MERSSRQKKRWKIGTFFNLPSNSIQPDRASSRCLFQMGSNQVRKKKKKKKPWQSLTEAASVPLSLATEWPAANQPTGLLPAYCLN